MSAITLPYPVCTLDNRELFPAHSEITEDKLREIISRDRMRAKPPVYLLKHRNIKADLLLSVECGYYRHIFSEASRKKRLMSLLERVEVAPEVLQVLDYFKRHDPYTYRHKLTVFALSTLLAQDLLGDADDVIREASTGPSHDIGKFCVPLQVLKKNKPLTGRERRLLEHHAAAGYVLLSYYLGDVHNLAVMVARDHHERRDGSGYPRGLSLEDRLVEIVAISDIYDALISPRPYRSIPYDNRTALEEITRLAERGKIGWDVVRLLVALNRQDQPYYTECAVSLQMRGVSPPGNIWGVTVPDDGENNGRR
jgi:HD-GYP domain-containing protein (c-di-GMP phosphodiesterase class II)